MPTIIECQFCGKETYAEISKCPHCGKKPSRNSPPYKENQHGDFNVVACLSKSINVFIRNFASFVEVTLILTAPTLLYQLFLLLASPEMEPESIMAHDFIVYFSAIYDGLILFPITAAIVYAVAKDVVGQPFNLGDCFRETLPMLFVILGAALVSMVVTTLGLALLIIPGFIVLCALWLFIPVIVVEKLGVLPSLYRSASLTEGFRMNIFGLTTIIWLVSQVSFFVIGSVFVLDFNQAGFEITTMVAIIIPYLLAGVLGAFMAVVNAIAYLDIRTAKEDIKVEQIVEGLN